MPHVAILVHEADPFEHAGYFLHTMAGMWADEGIRVSVVRGASDARPADLAVMHVDLTVVPPEYQSLAQRFPMVVNGRTADISKRRVSANLVREGDSYRGPVIVKTDLNCGGQREARLAELKTSARRPARMLRRLIPWARRKRLSSAEYRIFDSLHQVPAAVWSNPAFVVEKFLAERRDGLYCLRTWIFFGSKETNGICYSRHPIAKANNIVRRDPLPEVPAELRRMRRELGFDFGKFDYAVVDGRVVLYDANRTPTLPGFPPEQLLPRVRLLADGIHGFLRETPCCRAADRFATSR